jgi:FAD/FMN-containing dehydrogenase/Fe-S oxidoreductase
MNTGFLERLKKEINPEAVFAEKAHLTVYSSDASIYSVEPLSVVKIKLIDDIKAAVKICSEYGIPITSRGGATGLAGGAVGPGLILDFCDYENRIDIDGQRRRAMVTAGIIYDDLNLRAARTGLMFPPDPSSGDSCRIGGMLGNNSSGSRTVRYGTTRDYTQAINIITASGKEIYIEPLKAGSLEADLFFRKNLEFKLVFDLILRNRDIILPRRRHVKKNSCGYDLWSFLDRYDEGWIDFTKILVGSEGTLCIFESAELKLEPLPPELFTALLFFKRYNDIGQVIPGLLEINPYSLEVADSNSMDLIGREKYGLPGDAAAMLLLQFDLEKQEQIKDGIEKILRPDELSVPPVLETDPDKQKSLWEVRRELLPILYKCHPVKKPLPFVEDACLPPDKLPAMFEFLDRTFRKHELVYGSFGHIGDGNIHIKPLIDVSDAGDREKMRLVSMEVYNEILRQGGVVSGEHADGRVRAPFLKHVYGEEVYEIFCGIKRLLDPGWILNPGVKLVRNTDITRDMDIPRLNWDCSQCGKCVPGCPSFQARKNELYSPRGRIKIRNYTGVKTADQQDSLMSCINCKNCRTVCPAGCDASEDAGWYKNENRRFLLEPAFALLNNGFLMRGGAVSAAHLLPQLDDKPVRKLIERLSEPALRIHRDARLPGISKRPFASRFNKKVTGAKVAYFYGCADGYLENPTADKIVKVFEQQNIPLDIPEQVCCGVPAESYGHFDYARRAAVRNIESLNRYDYIITACGTCLLMLTDYPHFFAEHDRYYDEAKKLANKVYEVSEFLWKHGDNIRGDSHSKVTYHDSCHLRCAGVEQQPRDFIKGLVSDYVEMDYAGRCCGFAGTHYFSDPHESSKIFEIKKKSLIESGAEIVASCCPTCIMQFSIQQDRARSMHPIMLIAD